MHAGYGARRQRKTDLGGGDHVFPREDRHHRAATPLDVLASTLFTTIDEHDRKRDLPAIGFDFLDRLDRRAAGGDHIIDNDDAIAGGEVPFDVPVSSALLGLLPDIEGLHGIGWIIELRRDADHEGDRIRAHGQSADGIDTELSLRGGLLEERPADLPDEQSPAGIEGGQLGVDVEIALRAGGEGKVSTKNGAGGQRAQQCGLHFRKGGHDGDIFETPKRFLLRKHRQLHESPSMWARGKLDARSHRSDRKSELARLQHHQRAAMHHFNPLRLRTRREFGVLRAWIEDDAPRASSEDFSDQRRGAGGAEIHRHRINRFAHIGDTLEAGLPENLLECGVHGDGLVTVLAQLLHCAMRVAFRVRRSSKHGDGLAHERGEVSMGSRSCARPVTTQSAGPALALAPYGRRAATR